MPYINLDSTGEMYFEEFGEGPALLFISPGFGTHAFWEHQVASLADNFKTITFDWPGTGRSEVRNTRYNTDAIVGAIHALIHQLGLSNVTLVAHGIGVHCALLVAERCPESVQGLVLAGGGPWYGGDRDGQPGGFAAEFSSWWGALMSSTKTPAAEAYAALAREYLFKDKPSDALVGWFVDSALEWPLFVFNSYNSSMKDIDHRERLPLIKQKTLILQGRFDRKQRYEGAELLADGLENGQLITFESSAHMVNIEEMNLFNHTVNDFAL